MNPKSLVCIIILIFSSHCLAQFEAFAAKYNILSTIAGKGAKDDGTSGWLPQYEGGAAVAAELSRPHFAMADSAGNIYIADKEAHAIRMVTANGIITTVAGTNNAGYNGDGPATETQLTSPNGIWVKADGTFFILDLGNNKIRKVDKEGNLTTHIDDPSGISLGRGLWVSEDENLVYYVSGSRIKKWTKANGIVVYASGFSSPGHIIVDPSGYLVVTDRSADRVYRIINDTTREVIAGNGTASGGGNGFPATETGLHGVRGIWFFQDHSYLLATHQGSQIWYVDPFGIINLLLDGRDGDEYHSGDGQHFQTPGFKISEARGVSVDYQGNIIITENDQGFIRKISIKSTTSLKQKEYIHPEFELSIFPNPFNSTVMIRYVLAARSGVQIEIYNSSGQHIKTLLNEERAAGVQQLKWDGTNDFGKAVSSGIYYCIISMAKQKVSAKLLLLK